MLVDALFANILADETIDICMKISQNPKAFVEEISNKHFCDLLNLAGKKSFFTFNNKFYIQIDGVAMGSPLGPI